MKKEYSAGVVVFYDPQEDTAERQYLILHYPNGYWDLAKGKLEGTETKLEAANRELKEETGLKVEIIPNFEQSFSYIFKDFEGILTNKEVTFFIGKADTMDVTLSHEHIDYKWLPLRLVLKTLTYTNAQQLVSMADHFLSSSDK